MRNLKKVLTLVLTVAMLLSIMVVGTGAAFSDQSSIKNTEAVDACVALKIIDGKPNNIFDPAGNVTRAEMCKMICVALNGGKDPTLGTTNTPTFNDVRTNASTAWAEGYIESCYSQDIVSGVGGGRFNPGGNVTGTQAARMLLVALGYSANEEKFTGDNWAVNVNVRATQKGLYEDLEGIDANAALSRDNAAQMIWNALNAVEIRYNYTLNGNNGNLSSNVTVENKNNYNNNIDNGDGLLSLLEDKYATTVNTGIVTAVGHNTKGYTIDVNTVSGDMTPVTSANGITLTSLSSDPTEFVGKAVKVMYKAKDNVYGIYTDTDETMTIVTTTLGDFDTAGLAKNEFKLDGTTYKCDAASFGAVQTFDAIGGTLNNGATPSPTNYTTLSAVHGASFSKASTVTLIDYNGNEKIDVAVVTPVDIGQVTYLGTSKLTVKTSILTNVDRDDCVLYDGIAKDDYVAVVKGDYIADGNNVVTKLDKVSGKIGAIKGSDPTNPDVRIDGTWYTSVAKATMNDITAANANGTEGDFYLYNGYIVAKDAKTGSISDTAYVIKVGTAFDVDGNYQVKAMIDGETKVVSAEVGTTDSTITTSTADTYCTFDIDDGVYQFKPIANTNVPTGFTYATVQSYNDKKLYSESDGKVDTVGENSYIVDEDAVIYVKYKSDKYAILSGKDVLGWGDKVRAFAAASPILTKTEDGMTVIKGAALDLSGSSIPAANSTFGVITSSIATNNDKESEFTIWNGTEYIDVVTKSNMSGASKFDLVEYQKNTDDTYDIDVRAAVSTKTSIVGYNKSSGDINFGTNAGVTSASKTIVKDTLILFVNTDKNVDARDAGILGEEVAISAQPVAGTYNQNAIWYDDDPIDADLTVLVIDTVNNIYAAP